MWGEQIGKQCNRSRDMHTSCFIVFKMFSFKCFCFKSRFAVRRLSGHCISTVIALRVKRLQGLRLECNLLIPSHLVPGACNPEPGVRGKNHVIPPRARWWLKAGEWVHLMKPGGVRGVVWPVTVRGTYYKRCSLTPFKHVFPVHICKKPPCSNTDGAPPWSPAVWIIIGEEEPERE